MIITLFSIVCSFHGILYPLGCVASIVVYYGRVFNSIIFQLACDMEFTGGQQNWHCRLLSAVRDQNTVSCDSQSELKSAMTRPASWSHAELCTYTSCDWMSTESHEDWTQPTELAATTRNLQRLKENIKVYDVNHTLAQQLRKHVQLFSNLWVQWFVSLSCCWSLVRKSLDKCLSSLYFWWTY